MRKIFAFVVLLTMGMVAAHAECQDGPYGLQINGKEVVDAPKFGEPDFQGRVQYKASCVDLKAGDIVKLINTSCDATWMVDLDPYGSYESFEGGKSAGQLTCKTAGQYDFYIKLKENDDLVYVGPAEDCSGESYAGSAPAQCPDVMFQCFYWDSYSDKGYGNTKWAFLLGEAGSQGNEAEEIGKWFDLVWLPPMSLSTGGTGYLPICYSNLSGQFGQKSTLLKLISTLRQNGAKVVADIVANHIAGKQGWCGFAEMDFGTHGKFQPTPAWICKTDEMNFDSNAGDCQGKATGTDDDGYGSEANYDSGRD